LDKIFETLQSSPEPVDAAQVGWTARARAAGCVVWPMAEFTAVRATVHTAIGRRHLSVSAHRRADGGEDELDRTLWLRNHRRVRGRDLLDGRSGAFGHKALGCGRGRLILGSNR
jgi:hypothetical protein